MDRQEFLRGRQSLNKTQSQMARLLGVSLKAVQSFEQGLRRVPVHAERQLLFLLALKAFSKSKPEPCWAIERCPLETKRKCPAWEFRAGHLCWFINGTICEGKVQESWSKKMELCRKCEAFRPILSLLTASPGR
ncbi:MAG: transcriptional regulator [Deltaproteobacteria bacterium]|nr:transcriptional regulator [Deltaproteobacteria bacterium]